MRFRFLAARMLGALAIWLTGCGAFEFGTTPPDMLGQTAPDGATSVLCDPSVMGSKVKTCWDFAGKDTLDNYWTISGWDNNMKNCWQDGIDGLHTIERDINVTDVKICSLTLNIDFAKINQSVNRVVIRIEQKLESPPGITLEPQISVNEKRSFIFDEITIENAADNKLILTLNLKSSTMAATMKVPDSVWTIKSLRITPLCTGPTGLVKCSF